MMRIATSFVWSMTSSSMLIGTNQRRGSPSCQRTWISRGCTRAPLAPSYLAPRSTRSRASNKSRRP